MLEREPRLALLLERPRLPDANGAIDGECRQDKAQHAEHDRRTPEVEAAPKLDRNGGGRLPDAPRRRLAQGFEQPRPALIDRRRVAPRALLLSHAQPAPQQPRLRFPRRQLAPQLADQRVLLRRRELGGIGALAVHGTIAPLAM